ncbi:MAG: nitrophenyl compound nitroreductase subunit ArsF family protein [Terracidiphilus sp.]|jgi:ABC-type antimicrobial peptide transport system permease subunit
MKRRSLLAVTIILIAGALSIAVLARNSGSGNAQASSTTGISANARNSKVVAYYFHGTTRCYTCKKIEGLSHDVVTSNFDPQLKTDQLEWQSVNVEQPGNEHLFDDYKLVTWSLVLVTYKNGKQTDYKNLTDVWTLVNNEPAFRSYVKSGIQAALERVQ